MWGKAEGTKAQGAEAQGAGMGSATQSDMTAMMTSIIPVSHVLDKKTGTQQLATTQPDETLTRAAARMVEANVGALVVIEPHSGELLGIITERDYLKSALRPPSPDSPLKVADVMTEGKKLVYVTPRDHVSKCMQLMNDNHIRHLPVLQDGKPIGMISIKDVINIIADRNQAQIESMSRFIQQWIANRHRPQ